MCAAAIQSAFTWPQDLDALTQQLSAAQSEAATAGARVAELEAELKGSEKEVRALTKARDTMEVDLKAVLGRHAREVLPNPETWLHPHFRCHAFVDAA